MGKLYRVIMAVDPGETTGVCLSKVDRREVEKAGSGHAVKCGMITVRQFDSCGTFEGEMDVIEQITELIEEHEVEEVVIEDFILQPGRYSGNRSGLSPVRITAMLRMVLAYAEVEVKFQMPAQAKAVATNERMKKWGLWFKGLPHATDAARHLAIYVRRSK